jgi:alkylated DNA nucleotide flippase Atl1
MENHGRKEEVSTAEYTIEHILPQHVTRAWQQELGADWEAVHDRYLHTLGNLTLTGYNPEYSDRPFHKKRDMSGGFRDSPLRLNKGLGQLEKWRAAHIEQRAASLAAQAVAIWAIPALEETVLAQYRERFSDSRRFDWSQAHSILDALPAGRWTSYNNLAEAVGTGAQAMARHLAGCSRCVNAYRVLTWDGTIAEEFRWPHAEDGRDPADVLTAEGVTFAGGRADPKQQISAEELLALIGEDER